MKKLHQFPIFLKYPHHKTFFRITDANTFDQLDIIGTGYHLQHFTATVYPDKLLILDMMENQNGYWLESSEQEWNEQWAYCQENLPAI